MSPFSYATITPNNGYHSCKIKKDQVDTAKETSHWLSHEKASESSKWKKSLKTKSVRPIEQTPTSPSVSSYQLADEIQQEHQVDNTQPFLEVIRKDFDFTGSIEFLSARDTVYPQTSLHSEIILPSKTIC